MGRFVADQVLERIRQATDIVQLVRESVPLKKSGAGHKALCPFHREKTPSFHVNPEKQIFKCFGCGAAGDIFSFVMKSEGLTFTEAIRLLAERAHIALPAAGFGGPPSGEKTRLYEVNSWAAETFHRWLVKHPAGQHARRYLEERGLKPEIITRFQLGFSPAGPTSLASAAERKGYAAGLLAKAGLLLTREASGAGVDRFRNRLMFPIRDTQGRVIGFGARSLDGREPKYLNSPETPLFAKGRVLYGIHKARDAIREKRRAIVVEGYMDALAAHQFGVAWTVAVLGTALTRDHVRLLRRYANEAVVVFDADNAGQSSASRSVDAFAAEELAARVVSLPAGLDPDQFLRRNGVDEFLRRMDEAVEGVTYKLNRAMETLPGSAGASSLATAQALDDVLATVALMPNSVAQSLEIKKIARMTRLPEPTLQSRLERVTGSGRSRWRDQEEAPRPSAVREPERELLEVMLAYPSTAALIRSGLDLGLLRDSDVRGLIEAALKLSSSGQTVGAAEMLSVTQDESQRAILESILGKERIKSDDPDDWCRRLMSRIEERIHLEMAGELQGKVGGPPHEGNVLLEAMGLTEE